MRKILGITLVMILSLSLCIALCSCGGDVDDEAIQPDKQLVSWMQHIKDDALLTKVAIPGTHDSGTVGMMSSAMTQGATIKAQLYYGVRYFDIRVNGDDNGGRIFHGPINGVDFAPIADDILTFIKGHPTECLILDFQHFKNNGEECVLNVLKSKGLLDYAVTKTEKNLSDIEFISNLTMGDVRGKIIVLFGSDMADMYHDIFKRNNDDCTRMNASLDSLYIGNLHKKGSEYFIKNALPTYFDHILKKKFGLLVLQGQLTAPNVFKSLRALESEHSDNMNAYTRAIKDDAKQLYAVNIIMRDFIETDKEKVTSVLSLNYYKDIVKDEAVNIYKSICNIE